MTAGLDAAGRDAAGLDPADPVHADALRLLGSWVAPSAAQEALRTAYVSHLRAHPDGVRRSCRPAHLTASTLVLDRTGSRALLTLHAKAGAWFQLGGHVETGDPGLAAAAAREAGEESGLDSLVVDPVPLHLDAHAVPFCRAPVPAGAAASGVADGDALHLDVRFLAVAPAGSAPVVSAESSDVRWWPVTELPSDETSLRDLVDLGRLRLGVGTV